MSRHVWLGFVGLAAIGCGGGCSGAGTVDAAARPSPALELAQTSPANGQPSSAAIPITPAQTAPTTAPGRPYYDLARHLAHAEVYESGTLVMDYGVAGSAKYTLGGWLSGSGHMRTLDGASVTIIPGKTVKLLLPATASDQRQLTIRARGFKPGPLTVYVNDQTLTDATLSGMVRLRV